MYTMWIIYFGFIVVLMPLLNWKCRPLSVLLFWYLQLINKYLLSILFTQSIYVYSCASLVSCYIGTKIRNDSPKITIVLSLNINIQNNIVFLRLASERTTPTMIIILLCFFTSVFADNSCFRVNLQFNEKNVYQNVHTILTLWRQMRPGWTRRPWTWCTRWWPRRSARRYARWPTAQINLF